MRNKQRKSPPSQIPQCSDNIPDRHIKFAFTRSANSHRKFRQRSANNDCCHCDYFLTYSHFARKCRMRQ